MKTIVVIDDEFGLTDVLVAALSESGYRVFGAVDGQQGLALMQTDRPDLVMCDFMMPALDGPGVLRAMKADPRLAKVPIIMMSAVQESAVRRRTTEYDLFLRKPFDFEAAVAAIEKLLA